MTIGFGEKMQVHTSQKVQGLDIHDNSEDRLAINFFNSTMPCFIDVLPAGVSGHLQCAWWAGKGTGFPRTRGDA